MGFRKDEVHAHIGLLLENFKEDMLKCVNQLVSRIEEKDLDIKRLQEKLDELTHEIEEIKENSGKIKTDLNDVLSLKQILDNPTKDIIMYFQGVKWDQMSFDDILSAIKYSIEYKHYEVADMAFKALCDYYIRRSKVTNGGWEEFERVLCQYVNSQIGCQSCHVNSIPYVLSTVMEIGWVELLSSFLDKNCDKLEKIILKGPNDKYCHDLKFILLDIYFLLSYDKRGNRWLDKLLSCNTAPKSPVMNERQHLELLFISMCYQKDDIVIEQLFPMGEFQPGTPELECYNVFYDTVNNLISYEEGKARIDKLSCEMNILDVQIKSKALSYIMSVIDECQRGDELRVVV